MSEDRPMTLLESLEPCPFCGASGEALAVMYNEHSYQWVFITCQNCDARGPEVGGEDCAIREWNRRTT